MEPPGLPCSAVLLAGGKSSRFGSDKALYAPAPGGPSFLEGAAAALAGCRQRLLIGPHALAGWETLRDDEAGLGPLGGLVTGLRRASFP
ncbi:MAG TPA: NTP transferase domain-containing protein, partial [Deinococcales bacterium]|nr:NTP transferase domain-containing protein [Deinococcales bacterium]